MKRVETQSPVPTEGSAPRRVADPLEIVRAHQTGIWRYLRYLGADASDAEDLTQETFLAVLRAPFEDRGPATTAAYLQTVARNLFLKQRRRRRDAALTVDVEFDRIDSTWNRLCARDGGHRYLEALDACLELLDGRGRDALRMRYRDGCSRSEIAERLGIGVDGTKSLLRRVRQLLRECVERRIGS